MVFRSGVVGRNAATLSSFAFDGIIRGQIRADDRPALAFIHRLVQVVSSNVKHGWVMRRHHQGRRPIEPDLGFEVGVIGFEMS